MKKIILSLLLSAIFFSCFEQRTRTTTVTVKNSSDTTITVFLTLGGTSKWVQNVNGIFGITGSGSQGSFILNPGDSSVYTPKKPIQGNISFAYPPINCPVGITLYEFCLNNYGTVKDAQETVEISCVAGVSSVGRFTLMGGTAWSATTLYPTVTTFSNSTMGNNTNLVGVYPYGCTNCTNTAGMPTCITTADTPDSVNICNVQRFAKGSGGNVRIEFFGLTN